VDGAVGIAHRYHIPEILIGATVVSIGTTIPALLKKRLKMQGIMLLCIYAAYVCFQFFF